MSSRRHLWILLSVLGLIALLSRFPSPGAGLERLLVEYHYYGFVQGGDMNSRAIHKDFLAECALRGNDRALMRFLDSVTYVDGANGYWHFNHLISLLRQVDDARMAWAFGQLDPKDRVRHHFYLSYVADLKSLRPLTYTASQIPASFSNQDPALTFPLFDKRQVWP